jgi:MtfA peptidase
LVVIHVAILLFVSLYVIHNYLYKIELIGNFKQLLALGYVVLGKFPRKYKNILEKYFAFYNMLSDADKRKFENKLLLFLSSKEFIPRKLPEVSNEMRVLISACAVQLTFGLPDVTLKHFERILIYPDDYYSTINKKYHKGEVNPTQKLIVISWKAFLDGYIVPNDSRNLGFHEMAHALHLENIIRNGEHDFFDKKQLDAFDAIAIDARNKETHPAQLIFRKTAFTDTHEFFAVAVEHFFESPQELKQTLPDLYQILATLLQQDPAKN